jgi:hypothetical protein
VLRYCLSYDLIPVASQWTRSGFAAGTIRDRNASGMGQAKDRLEEWERNCNENAIQDSS